MFTLKLQILFIPLRNYGLKYRSGIPDFDAQKKKFLLFESLFIDHYEGLGWILPLRIFEPIQFTKTIFKNPRGQKSGRKKRNARKLIRESNETYSFVLGEFKDIRSLRTGGGQTSNWSYRKFDSTRWSSTPKINSEKILNSYFNQKRFIFNSFIITFGGARSPGAVRFSIRPVWSWSFRLSLNSLYCLIKKWRSEKILKL